MPFGTRLFIKRRASGGWYQVTLVSGQHGYVAAVYVKRNLPEPTAELFKIKGQTALEIVTTSATATWAKTTRTWRFYVNVLEYVNRGPGLRGIYQSRPGNKDWDAWKDVKTRSGYQYLAAGRRVREEPEGHGRVRVAVLAARSRRPSAWRTRSRSSRSAAPPSSRGCSPARSPR